MALSSITSKEALYCKLDKIEVEGLKILKSYVTCDENELKTNYFEKLFNIYNHELRFVLGLNIKT